MDDVIEKEIEAAREAEIQKIRQRSPTTKAVGKKKNFLEISI